MVLILEIIYTLKVKKYLFQVSKRSDFEKAQVQQVKNAMIYMLLQFFLFYLFIYCSERCWRIHFSKRYSKDKYHGLLFMVLNGY